MGDGFHRLHPSISNRLNRELYDNKPVHFKGTLTVKASFIGKLIGILASFSGGVCHLTVL
jgi:hypothetical protein